MTEVPPLLGPQFTPGQRKARIFTDIPSPNGQGRQFFDVPLAPDQMVGMAVVSGWQLFMTNLLQHRGILLTNAWIPERVITLIAVDPDEQVMDPSKWDPEKVVQLRPTT